MRQLLNLLLAAVGVVITALGFIGLRGDRFMLAAFPVGLGLIALAYWGDKKRANLENAARRQSIADRIADLTKSSWASHQSLKIPGSLWLVVLMLVTVAASGTASYVGVTSSPIRWTMTLIGLPFLVLSLVGLPRAFANLVHSALELRRSGIVTPIHGAIPWSEIAGIYLQATTHRDVTHYALMFRVPNYSRIVKDVHWTESLLGLIQLGAAKRGVISVPIKDGKEKPEVVTAVAHFLWKQATGNDYQWNPLLPNEVNDAARRAHEFARKHEAGESLQRALEANPDKALKELERFKTDIETVKSGRAKLEKQLNWTIAIALIGVAWAIAWPFLKRL